MPRNKKPLAVKQDTMLKAEGIADTFSPFVGGYRVLFLVHRAGEGGKTNNTHVKKVIVKGKKEYIQGLYELLLEKESSELPLRIYAAVNERSFDKAIRQFKFEQLEADYYAEDHKQSFYTDCRNRFIGALMSPSSAVSKKFIVDVDSMDEFNIALKEISLAGLNDEIITQYKTKNGWHIVMNPFNPALLPVMGSKINKDGLILLSY